MDGIEKNLTGMIVENLPEELEINVRVAQSVAVCKVEFFAEYFGSKGLPVHNESAFLL